MTEQGPQPTEEELRQLEEQLKRVRVEDVVADSLVSILNLGARRAGLIPGTEDERDPEQVRVAVEAVRAMLPLVEPALGPSAPRVRDALSQLQLAYTRMVGPSADAPDAPAGDAAAAPAEPPAPDPGGPGPAQQSGRLWIPGQ